MRIQEIRTTRNPGHTRVSIKPRAVQCQFFDQATASVARGRAEGCGLDLTVFRVFLQRGDRSTHKRLFVDEFGIY
jgi:hypothetical protein